MKKNLVVTIGGASNSCIGNKGKIVAIVQKALSAQHFHNIPLELRELSSLGTKQNTNEWFGKLNPDDYASLTIIGKSLGAVREYQAYSKNRKLLDKFKRVSLVFIDPHSPLPNYYGRLRGFTIKNTTKSVCGWNVHQKQNGSAGARIKFKGPSFQCEIMEKDISHFNIVFHPTVGKYINDALRWAFFADHGANIPSIMLDDELLR